LLGRRKGIGAATVQRYFSGGCSVERVRIIRRLPQVLGIDEHFFTRKKGLCYDFPKRASSPTDSM